MGPLIAGGTTSSRSSAAFAAQLLLCAWVAAVLVGYLPGAERPGLAGREALVWGVGALAIALLVAAVPARPRRPALALAAVVVAAVGAGVLAAPRPESASAVRDGWLLLVPVFAGLAVAWPPGAAADRFDRMLEVVLAGVALWLAGSALLQGVGHVRLFAESFPPSAGFVNRNALAQLLVPLFLLVLGAAARARGSAARAIFVIAAGTTLGLVVATRTRGAWLGLAIATVVCGLLLFRRRRIAFRRARLTVLAVGVVAAALAGALEARQEVDLPSVGSTISSFADPLPGSGEVRRALWSNTWAMTVEHPWIGVGAGRFSVVYPLHAAALRPTPGFGMEQQALHAHQDPLEWAAELGLPAALALSVLLAGGALAHARCALTNDGGTDRAEVRLRAAFRCAALCGVAVHGLVSFPLHAPAPALLVWLLAGRGWAERDPTAGSSPRRYVPSIVLAAALAGAALWTLPQALEETLASRRLLGAIEAQAAGNCARALELSDAVTEGAGWLRRERGMAAMLRFHCDPQPASSLARLEPALARHPNQLNLLSATGARRLKSGDTAGARSAFDHALGIAPDSSRLWLGRAMTAFAAGKTVAARNACGRLLEIDPDWPAARNFCRRIGVTPP